MSTDTQARLGKAGPLPDGQPGGAEEFGDLVATKPLGLSALDRLLAIASAIEAAGAQPITDDEIEVEVQAMRAPPGGGDVG